MHGSILDPPRSINRSTPYEWIRYSVVWQILKNFLKLPSGPPLGKKIKILYVLQWTQMKLRWKLEVSVSFASSPNGFLSQCPNESNTDIESTPWKPKELHKQSSNDCVTKPRQIITNTRRPSAQAFFSQKAHSQSMQWNPCENLQVPAELHTCFI